MVRHQLRSLSLALTSGTGAPHTDPTLLDHQVKCMLHLGPHVEKSQAMVDMVDERLDSVPLQPRNPFVSWAASKAPWAAG